MAPLYFVRGMTRIFRPSPDFALSLRRLNPSHIQNYAGGLLLALEKPPKDGGGLRPIICGESWRRCFASLAANAAMRPITKLFFYIYLRDFFKDCRSPGWRFPLAVKIPTARAKILSSMRALPSPRIHHPSLLLPSATSAASPYLIRAANTYERQF